MFGEKKSRKMYIENIYWKIYIGIIFTSFNTTPLILLVKVILLRNCNSVKDVYSIGLMLVCRWEGVNALVQKKFHSTIHLLNQHLHAQSTVGIPYECVESVES